MNTTSQVSLDPSALSAFAASLASLPSDEIRKAKALFIRNEIADYRMEMKSAKAGVIVLGIMSLIPLFLLIFFPTLIAYRAAKENGIQKIKNALEVWKDDLGGDYEALTQEIQTS